MAAQQVDKWQLASLPSSAHVDADQALVRINKHRGLVVRTTSAAPHCTNSFPRVLYHSSPTYFTLIAQVLRDVPRALGFLEDLPSDDNNVPTGRLFEQILRRTVELCGPDPGAHTDCTNVNAISTLLYFARGLHQQPVRVSDDKQRMDSHRVRCISAVGVFALRRVLQLKIENCEVCGDTQCECVCVA